MARGMRDSGVAWIGEMPKGWGMNRLKFTADCFDGKRVPIDASQRRVGPYPYWGAGSIQDYVDDYIFDEELVLLGEDGAPFFDNCRDVAFLVKGKIWVNNHIHVLKAKSVCTNQYLCYTLNVVDYSDYVSGSILLKLTQGRMREIVVPLPPLPEQRAIADYLDKKCAAIDAAVTEAKKGIEEYKAWKKSLIFEMVTGKRRVGAFNAETQRGGGAEKMKPSGIPWIGDIPEGWKVSRVKLHYELILGKMLCSTPSNDANIRLPYVCAANVHFDGVTLGNLKEMWFSDLEVNQYEIREGDLLVVEGGAGAGGAAICPEFEGHIGIQNSILLVRNRHCRDNRYLRYLLETLVKDGYVDFVCNKATIPHFTKEKLGNVPLPIPLLAEQKAIADYLDEKCAAIDAMVAEKEALIADLEAYKKSLIYETVTGKREVA